MKTTIDKAELKKQIIYNVKTLYRKTIDEACLLYTSDAADD